MRLSTLILLLLSITICHGAKADTTNESRIKHIKISSRLVSQDLEFTVITPQGYDPKSTQRYPVFYTQTDSIRLKLIKQQLDWLSHLDFGPVPKMLIVALPSITLPNQPRHKNAAASGLSTPLAIKVLTEEIFPYIDTHFHNQPFKIIEGYSTQANFPLDILASKPALFNAYISISPALVLDKSALLKRLTTTLSKHQLTHTSLYTSLGSFKQNKPLFKQLEKIIEGGKSKLAYQLVDLSEINYYTTPVTALPQALEQLFKDRQPQDIEQFRAQGMEGVIRYYEQLKDKYGYLMSPLSTLVELGQLQLEHNEATAAQQTFEHIIKLKPNSLYYLTLLAKAQQKNHQILTAKQTLQKALKLAKATKIQGEIDYVESQIKALVQ